MSDDQNRENQKLAPYQRASHYQRSQRALIPWAVHMRAYEVYKAVHGEQLALIDLEGKGCRGGFSTGELLAFLYARSFPPAEWRHRVEEAFKGMTE